MYELHIGMLQRAPFLENSLDSESLALLAL